jgi:hypothetical protein
MKPILEIDGAHFETLEQFYVEIGRVLTRGASWGHNLDAFNDLLKGGFGTPDGGFIFRWRNSEISKRQLGYPETVRQLERRLSHCHPSSRASVTAQLMRARQGAGPTGFDWLVDIIRRHGAGGSDAEDGVELELI